MQNYFVEIFGLIFIIFMILILLYCCVIVIQKIIGRIKFFKDEVMNEYIKVKVEKEDKKSRIEEIKRKLGKSSNV